MKTTQTPIQDTLDRLAKLDDQFSRGFIRKYDMDTQRLIALADLVGAIKAEDEDPYAFNQPW